jgi:Cu-Zn family superoxide dismutase
MMSGLLWVSLAQDQQSGSENGATAELRDAQGNNVGTASLSTVEGGAVRLQVELDGFEAASTGEHGIHIHETGSCEPDFKAAGGHFNPTGNQHGLLSRDGPHAGDLPNIRIEEDGSADYQVTTLLVTLGEGDNSLFDDDGSAIVIHADPDDLVTDPSGGSGDRIACGVIERQGQQAQEQQQAETAGAGEQAAAGDQEQLVQQGEELFAQNCRSCHGASGKGGRGIPALAGNENLADAERVIQQILHGGGGMPPFARLSDQQIAALATFVRLSWGNDFGAVSVEQIEEQRN